MFSAAHRRERPQGGAEPGVQHVLILAPALARRRSSSGHSTRPAFRPVPDRDTVAPQLAEMVQSHAIRSDQRGSWRPGRWSYRPHGRRRTSSPASSRPPTTAGKARFDRLAGALRGRRSARRSACGHHAALLLEGQRIFRGLRSGPCHRTGCVPERGRSRRAPPARGRASHREVVRIVRRVIFTAPVPNPDPVVIRDDHHLAVGRNGCGSVVPTRSA